MDLQFLENNWWLILAMIVSGGMLLWPMIGYRWSTVREIGAMEATQLINRRNALMLDVREPKEYQGGQVPNAVHLPQSQFASRGVEFLRVVDPDYPRAGFQDHGASGDWPGERAHSGLVHACHGMMAACPERGLEAEHLAEALPFRPIFGAPLVD